MSAERLSPDSLGDYQAAFEALTEAEPQGVPDDRFVDWLLLAMTCQKLDRAEEARSWLVKATNVVQPPTHHWIVRLVRQQLREQAEKMVKNGA